MGLISVYVYIYNIIYMVNYHICVYIHIGLHIIYILTQFLWILIMSISFSRERTSRNMLLVPLTFHATCCPFLLIHLFISINYNHEYKFLSYVSSFIKEGYLNMDSELWHICFINICGYVSMCILLYVCILQ